MTGLLRGRLDVGGHLQNDAPLLLRNTSPRPRSSYSIALRLRRRDTVRSRAFCAEIGHRELTLRHAKACPHRKRSKPQTSLADFAHPCPPAPGLPAESYRRYHSVGVAMSNTAQRLLLFTPHAHCRREAKKAASHSTTPTSSERKSETGISWIACRSGFGPPAFHPQGCARRKLRRSPMVRHVPDARDADHAVLWLDIACKASHIRTLDRCPELFFAFNVVRGRLALAVGRR